MHVILGLLGLVGVLWFAAMGGHQSLFHGLVHPPAVVLVGLGPLFIALASYPFDELRECLRNLAAALRFSVAGSRARLYEELTQFAQEVKQRRTVDALERADACEHPSLRQLGPLAVRGYPAAQLEETASAALYAQTSRLRRSEEVLISLARVSPATGLIGTVLGLIALLRNLSRPDLLGPSMALALLCTLYGLVLANALYQPLARRVHAMAAARAEEGRLVARALALLVEGRSVADVRALFEEGTGAGEESPSVAAIGGQG